MDSVTEYGLPLLGKTTSGSDVATPPHCSEAATTSKKIPSQTALVQAKPPFYRDLHAEILLNE